MSMSHNNSVIQFGRRELGALAAGMLAVPGSAWARNTAGRTVFYAAVGANLVLYQVDDKGLTLTRQTVTTVPEAIQYIWRHPVKNLVYVAYSNRFSTKRNDNHGVAAYRLDPLTGQAPAGVLDGFLPPDDTTHVGEGFVQYRGIEIRPADRGEVKFAVGRLPQHEVGYPEFTGGPDDQVDIRDAVGIQIMIEGVCVDGICRMFGQQFIHGVDDFSTAGVIKSQIENQTVVILRKRNRLLNHFPEVRRKFLQPSDVSQLDFMFLCPVGIFPDPDVH